MRPVVSALLACLGSLLRSRCSLALQVLALQHQVAVYKQSVSRPKLRPTDRLLWVWLSRRVGKRRLWLFAVAMLGLAFSGLALVQPGQAWLMFTLGIVAGIGGGCGQVVGPSIQADIIDWDELATGERKEGAYFAVWNFVRKSAYGLASMMLGLLLAAVGYEPNAVQDESTKLGLPPAEARIAT